MGHPARNRKRSKPDVSCQLGGPSPLPQEGTTHGASTTPGPLAGLDERVEQIKQREREFRWAQKDKGSTEGLLLTDEEWDAIFCMAVKHHFEQEQVWVPNVLRTMALLEGINDKTGRPCRIYVRPGRRVIMVETLS